MSTATASPSPQEGSKPPEMELVSNLITQVNKDFLNLYNENISLERLRDQYTIHLHQCQNDYEILQKIYKKLKMKVEGGPAKLTKTPDSLIKPIEKAPVTIKEVTNQITITQQIPTFHAKCLKSFTIAPHPIVIEFSPDGNQLAMADVNSVYLFDKAGTGIAKIFIIPDSLTSNSSTSKSVKYSPDGKQLLVTGNDNNAFLFDIESERLLNIFKGHTKDVTGVLFSLDGKSILTGGLDGALFSWNASTYEIAVTRRHPTVPDDGAIVCISSSEKMSYYTVGFRCGLIGIYDEKFEQPMISFEAYPVRLRGLSISPFDSMIATVPENSATKLWAICGTVRNKGELSKEITNVCFSPKSNLLFTALKTRVIEILDSGKKSSVLALGGGDSNVSSIAHSPVGNVFAFCSEDGNIYLWEYEVNQ